MFQAGQSQPLQTLIHTPTFTSTFIVACPYDILHTLLSFMSRLPRCVATVLRARHALRFLATRSLFSLFSLQMNVFSFSALAYNLPSHPMRPVRTLLRHTVRLVVCFHTLFEVRAHLSAARLTTTADCLVSGGFVCEKLPWPDQPRPASLPAACVSRLFFEHVLV